MSETVFVKLFGLLVTFSKGLLRNHTAADGTVEVLVKRNPLEFVLNKQSKQHWLCVVRLFPDDCLHRRCLCSSEHCCHSAALQLWYSAKSTITKYIKGQTEIYWPFQFRAKGQSHKPFQKWEQMFQISDCRSLVKSALYSWSFLSLSLWSVCSHFDQRRVMTHPKTVKCLNY